MDKGKKNRTRMLMAGMLAAVFMVMMWRVFASVEEKTDAIQPFAVSTERVKKIEKSSVVPLSGNVEGLTSSIISSRYSGKVVRVLVEDGQSVAEGQALFVMDTVELGNALRVAQNNVNQASARYANDLDEYQRYEILYNQGAYSRQQLESARTKMLSSQAELDSAQANLNSAQKQIDEATVVSPVDGVAANKNLTVGQNISAGTQVMTVEQMDAVHVVINVEQRDMAFLQMGTRVAVKVDAYPDKSFAGVVNVISPVAGKESRMFRVKIKVDNPGFLLKPGMFVQVELNLGKPKAVLSVPQKAVLSQKGIQYVFAAEDGKAKKIRVKTGDIIGDRMEIIEGLSEETVVVTDNLEKIKDGDPLKTEEAA